MIVYGDLLFLINFSMDFLCFYISFLLLHQKLPLFRAFLSAFVGGIYSVASLFIVTNEVCAFAFDISVLVMMCLLVYLRRGISLGKIFKGIFLYFVVSALLGGLMTSLFSLFNRMEILAKDFEMSEGIDVWMFALLVIIGTFVTIKGGRIFRSSASEKVVKLKIENELGEVELQALVDSGNFAVEPISGKSVVFVNVEKCKKIIEETMYNCLKYHSKIGYDSFVDFSKIRMIPAQSISGSTFFPAIKFKNVSLKVGKSEKNIDVYIAFVNSEMLGDFDAIISEETIV